MNVNWRALGFVFVALMAMLAGTISQANAQAAPTVTTISQNLPTTERNQNVTFTVQVTSEGTAVTRGGVNFIAKDVVSGIDFFLGNIPLNVTNMITFNLLSVGTYDVRAEYLGIGGGGVGLDFAPSTSTSPARHTVTLRPTTITVTSAPNPSTPGQSVSLTATVLNSVGAALNTGNIEIFDDGVSLGSGPLLGANTLTVPTTTLAAGANNITAVYTPTPLDPDNAGSTSPVHVHTVNAAAATTTTITSSLNPSNFGQSVTFTATVSDGNGSAISGPIEFRDGTTVLCTVTLPANTCTTSALIAATHTITAAYLGEPSKFQPSSQFLVQNVRRPTAVTVVSTPNPSLAGAAVTLTATVTVTSGTGTPPGSVEFFDDGASLGTAALNNGTATITTSALALGNNNIDAVYTPSLPLFNPAALDVLYVHVVNAATNTDSAALDDVQEAATSVAASLASEMITDSVGEEIGAALSGQVQVMSASDGEVGFVYTPAMGKGSIVTPAADVASGETDMASWRIWSSLRYTDFDSRNLEGDQVNALLGTTFLFGDGLIAGLVAGYENQDYESSVNATLKGEGFNFGGYVGGALDGGLRFDLQAHASFLDYDLASGAVTGSTDGTRLIVGGGIAHTLQFGALTIDPTARFSGTWEWQDGYTDSAAVAHAARDFNFGRIAVGVKAARRFDMGDSASFSPFVTGYGDYRFSDGDMTSDALMDGMSARVGIGFDLRTAKGITASGLAEFSGLGLEDNVLAQSYKAQIAIPF